MFLCCRICLLQNCKLISIESYGLRTAYEQLTGVSVEHDDGLPRELCVECATLLDKYHKFRDKSIRGNSLLMGIYSKQGCHNSIDEIDRVVYKLYSNIYRSTTYCTIITPETIGNSITKDANIKTSHDTQEQYYLNDVIEFTNVDTCLNSVEVKNEFESTEIENEDESADKFEFGINDPANTEDFSSDEDLYTKLLKMKKENKSKRKRFNKKLHKSVKKTKSSDNVNDVIINKCFNVKNLSFDEQKLCFEERKLSDKFLNAVFKCQICFKGFSAESPFNTHMKKHNEESGEYICEICQQHFRNPRLVSRHTRCTHQFRYECTTCHNVHLSSRSAAIVHAKWHQGKKYTCDLCGAVFEKNTTYLSHVRIKHPSDNVCCYCGYSFVGEKGLYVHVNYKHYGESQVELSGPWCNDCNIQFYNGDALTVHNQIKHTDGGMKNDTPRPPNCAPRKIETRSTSRRRVFKKTSTNEGNNIEQNNDIIKSTSNLWCNICEIQFANNEERGQHQLELHGVSNDESATEIEGNSGKTYPCDECGLVYEIYTSYLSHLRIKHPSSHVCPHCGYSYVSRKGLELHTTKRHYQDTTVPILGPWCDLCAIQFASSEALQVHLGIKHANHDNKIRNSMPFIGEKSNNLSNEYEYDIQRSNNEILNVVKRKCEPKTKLNKKKRGVKRPKLKIPGPCEVCGVPTRSFREYGKHFRRAHPTMTRATYPGTCICDKCGRKFTCEAVLRDHMLVHGDVSQYSCTDCKKTFKTQQQLKNHCLIHQSPSHECPICHLKYNHSGNRNRHMKQVHSDVKDYKCDFCEKSFKTDCDKKIHMKHIHLKEPWPKRNRNGPKERQRQTFMRYRRRKETENWSFEQAGDNAV